MNAGRIDFYTKVHKGLRAGLFALSQRAAAADYAAPESVAALAAELRRLAARLSAHARHEERFIHPLLAEKLGASGFDAEHAQIEALQRELESRLEALACCADPEPGGAAFYRTLNVFIARYLEHLEREEATMPLLWERCSDAELAEVMKRFGASRTLDETLADVGWMLPALSAAEQKELIGGVGAAIARQR